MAYHLTFRKSQARTLRNIATSLRRRNAKDHHIDLFENAARKAKACEPILVQGTEAEAERVADGFKMWGAARPRVAPADSPAPAFAAPQGGTPSSVLS